MTGPMELPPRPYLPPTVRAYVEALEVAMNAPDERRWTLDGRHRQGPLVSAGPFLRFDESVEVMPVQPVERPRDAEAIERVARTLYQWDLDVGFVSLPWEKAMSAREKYLLKAEKVLAALGPVERPDVGCFNCGGDRKNPDRPGEPCPACSVERPCEVTDAMKHAGASALTAPGVSAARPGGDVLHDYDWTPYEAACAVLEAARGAVVEGDQ